MQLCMETILKIKTKTKTRTAKEICILIELTYFAKERMLLFLNAYY